ncbi:MAG TPA: prolyl oligopeptidase family serine peptidase [Terriglobales bacterium]|nr:prolyl oligopeptidase family serine peptidase [Terriglobales bacterium]
MKRSRLAVVFIVLASVLAAAAPAAAVGEAPKPAPAKLVPWTAEDILLAESASQWEISPDGKWAVWVKGRMDKDKNGRVSNLFLTNLETKKEIQLTRGTEMNGQPRWSPDGGTVAFTSSRSLPKPNPDAARSQLWLMGLPGGEPYPVTESARGVQAYRWVDNDTLIFSAQEAPALYEQELKQKKDSSRVVDDVAHEPPVRLYRLSLKDKKVARLTDNTDFIQSWDVTPDGKHALTVHAQYLSFEWDQKILPKTFVYDLANGHRREILVGERIPPMGVESARDGSGFYFAAPYSTDPRFFTASILLVYFHDLASGRTLKVDLGWDKGLGGGLRATPDGFLATLADGTRFLPVRYVKTGLAWKRTDLDGEHAKNLLDFAVSDDAKTIVYAYSTASTPTQWYAAKLDGAKLANAAKLTDLNPGFKAKAPARTEIVLWKGALGEEVEGLLYYPKDYEPGRRYPLFTAPHGGPAGADMDAWDESWAYAHQLICQRGAFILKPNYHGSSNYGLKFVESICCGHYYDYPVEDIQKGVDLLVAKGLVDPDRVGTFGWSNGSILSIELGVVDPDRYKVVCAGAGDVEWISDWANVDFGQSFDTYYFGKSPLEDPQLYVRLSPLYKLDRVKAPTIIFFGTEDRNVPTSQGWIHYRALYHLGKVPVKFILFPGEPHGLQEYAHQMRKLDEEMAWLDAHFFKTLVAANEAFKRDSPLGQALRRKGIARVGAKYGVAAMAGGALLPEAVTRGALEVGRFEVTRAQYAAFDPAYPVAPGTENFPANGLPFEKAKAYSAWLAKLTGQAWRLPTEEEATALAEGAAGENTLDYWAGYALNPDDARRLEAKVRELGAGAPLLKEVGSFAGAGQDDEALLFDLGGNVAEWAVAKDGSGKAAGGSADRPADAKARAAQPSAEYTGFRVVRDAGK